ncbi:hypothetical protein LMG10661_02988 [Ralstonia syzygii subsp. syzygii]|nr:hypothetical protein LMG10661_02988 [Ralstonia syzygii subsp. syzygii]
MVSKKIFRDMSLHPSARQYRLRELEPASLALLAPEQGLAAISLTVLQPDPKDESKDELYIDAHRIDRANWRWHSYGNILSWREDPWHHSPGGHVVLSDDGTGGFGQLLIDGREIAVSLDPPPAVYSCGIKLDSGAKVVKQGGVLVPQWNPDSQAWKDATTVDAALRFSYQVKRDPDTGLKYFSIKFEDVQTSDAWEVPFLSFDFAINSDLSGSFALHPGMIPAPDSRADLDPPANRVTSVFPYLFRFQTDVSRTKLTGAMLVGKDDESGNVYGISGVAANPSIVGLYHVQGGDMAQPALIGVHSGCLTIGSSQPGASWVEGNVLHWRGLPEEAARIAGLPASGFLEFSPCGGKVVAGTLGARGLRTDQREMATRNASIFTGRPRLADINGIPSAAQLEAAPLAATLDPYTLLNMNPYEKTDKGEIFDAVQQAATSNVYKGIQYYMEPSLRSTFVSANPPDLSAAVKAIITNNTGAKNFYNGMGVPYIAVSLEKSTDSAVANLNTVRASAWVRSTLATSDIYRDQAALLYKLAWCEKFPSTNEFLADQANPANHARYAGTIDTEAASWKNQVKQQATEAGTAPDDPDLQKMLQLIDDLARLAKDKRYWAWKLFRIMTSPVMLSSIDAQLLSGNTSRQLTQEIQRYLAILTILDDSNRFAMKYNEVLNIYQIAVELPRLLDYGNNQDDYRAAAEAILKKFIDKYINTQDPDMRRALDAAQELFAQQGSQRLIDPYIDAFFAAAALRNSTGIWSQVFTNFEKEVTGTAWKSKLGRFGLKVSGSLPDLARLSGMAMGVAAIVMLAGGVVRWRDLKPLEKGRLIEGGIALFTQVIGAVIKGTIKAAGFISRLGTRIWAWYRGVQIIEDQSARVQSSLARWLAGRLERPIPGFARAAASAAEAGEGATQGRLARALFGRNLDEFLAFRVGAALALASIGLSIWGLVESKEPLETTMNALFLASGVLELIGIAANWVVVGGLVAEGSMLATTLGAIAVGAGVLAIFAAIAGAVVLVIWMQGAKPKSPVQSFVDDQATQAGLFMPFGVAIDYFAITGQANGIAIGAGASFSQVISRASGGQVTVGALTHSFDTVFNLAVDPQGRAQFYLVEPDTQKVQLLTASADGRAVTFEATLAGDDAQRQLWRVEATGDPTWQRGDGEIKILDSAPFRIYSAKFGRSSTLTFSANQAILSSGDYSWVLGLKLLRPDFLSYNDGEPIVFQTSDTDRIPYYPTLNQLGADPKTWSISEPLPDGLIFDTDKGNIGLKPGGKLKKQPLTSYRVQVSNSVGSTSASVQLEIREAAVALAAAFENAK